MATIKAYTDLEQSKKLAEILPLESADMWWSRCTIANFGDNKLIVSYSVEPCNLSQFRNTNEDVPAWSLSTLLDVLPTKLQIVLAINDFQGDRKEKYFIGSVEHDKYGCYADNPVDACYELLLKLNEVNLL